jgi:hypothetical protein
MSARQVCERETCTREGIDCYLPDDGPERPYVVLCDEHAFAAGFCKLCGSFWGGIESFEFGPGYCENCEFQIKDSCGENDEDDGSDDFYDPAIDY